MTCIGLHRLGFLMQPLAQLIIEMLIENGLERVLNCPRKVLTVRDYQIQGSYAVGG